MSAFEDHLLRIHAEISINEHERQPYTHMFDVVKNWLIEEMRNVSPVFRKLYKGLRLFGSYSNRVRIIKPSEFDVFILLGFPFSYGVGLDNDRPGFVHLDLQDTLDQLEGDPYYRDVYNHFCKLVNKTDYLRRNGLQRWIQWIINKVFETCYPPYGYTVEYTKRSVAHNIYMRETGHPCRKISIDFVPAIQIGKVSWMHYRGYPPFKDDYFYSFCAIPKSLPKSGRWNNNLTFQLVNPTAEHDLLWDKQNLKIVYRLLKSFRNRYGLKRLKSYFLTAIFLWEAKRRNPNFWYHSVDYLFVYMLGKLCDYFNERNLPYFWVRNFNLLSILRPEEITEYANMLNCAYNTLSTYSDQLYLTYDRACDHFELPSDLK